MIRRSLSSFVLLVVLFAGAAYCQQIPPGTILPVMATSTVDSTKSKPGDRLSGELMQDVVLPSGERIRTGAKVAGQVIESSSASAAAGARLVVRFESLIANGKQYRIAASLRSMASMQDVFFAQLSVGTFDEYGTSPRDWTTVQVGGAAVYRGDGTVRSAMDIVGRATDYGAVTAKLTPAPKRGCPSDSADDGREQSLWVFSPWACGVYGFDDLKIAHHGVTSPTGTIILSAPTSFRVSAGSGWLLRVVSAPPTARSSAGE